MKYNTQYFIDLAKKQSNNLKPTLVVAFPYDDNTIEALYECYQQDLINIILVGNKLKIEKAIQDTNLPFNNYQLFDLDNEQEIITKTMTLLKNKQADMLMKGLVDTSLILKGLLNKEYELRTKHLMSHVCLSFNENYDRFYVISDAAMNIKPTLEQKKEIIKNAVWFDQCLGIKEPKVAILCAKEKVNEKMPDTVDAQALHEMNINGSINNCIVSGPLQIDLAIDEESAKIKNVNDPVAGHADVLICPNIEAANILTKGLTYLGNWSFAGLIIGAKVPFILTSRSTCKRDRIVSIALACLCVNKDYE